MASAVSNRSIPAGVGVRSRASADEMPELEPSTKQEEREEEEEREEDLVVDVEDSDISSTAPQTNKNTQRNDYSTSIKHWKGSAVKEEDILFQLHLRGAGLTKEQEEEYTNTKKGKGKRETGRLFCFGWTSHKQW